MDVLENIDKYLNEAKYMKKLSKQDKEDIDMGITSDKAFDKAQIFIWKAKKKVKNDKELEDKIMKTLENSSPLKIAAFVKATKREGYPDIQMKILKKYGLGGKYQ